MTEVNWKALFWTLDWKWTWPAVYCTYQSVCTIGISSLTCHVFEHVGLPCGSACKESACNVGDLGSIPGLGRSPGEGKGYPLQYSGLENFMQNQTLLSSFYFHLSMPLSLLRSSAAGEKQKLLSKCENYGWSSLLRFLYQQWQARFMFTHLWWTSFPRSEPREGCSNDNLPSAYHVSGIVLRDLHMGPHLIAYNNFKKQFFFF